MTWFWFYIFAWDYCLGSGSDLGLFGGLLVWVWTRIWIRVLVQVLIWVRVWVQVQVWVWVQVCILLYVLFVPALLDQEGFLDLS